MAFAGIACVMWGVEHEAQPFERGVQRLGPKFSLMFAGTGSALRNAFLLQWGVGWVRGGAISRIVLGKLKCSPVDKRGWAP